MEKATRTAHVNRKGADSPGRHRGRDLPRFEVRNLRARRVAEDGSSPATCYPSLNISSPRWRRTAMLKVWFAALGVG